MLLKEHEEIKELVKKSGSILVVGHIMPDGDCISSVLSAGVGFERLGKKVLMIVDDEIPWYYYEFPDVARIRTADALGDFGYDLIVVLDASSPDRVGRVQKVLGTKTTVVMDHHGTNTMFGDVNLVIPTIGSTAQLVFMLNKKLGVHYDPLLATYNFMGIATDTGFFRYSNADLKVFEDAAELVGFGARPNDISNAILENRLPEELKLFADVVANMKLECDGMLAYSYVSREMFEKYGLPDHSASGFVSELRAMKGVEVAILFTERSDGSIHASMRSKKMFDLREVAVRFGGGGHPQAAGFSVKGRTLSQVIDEVIPYVVKQLKKAAAREGLL